MARMSSPKQISPASHQGYLEERPGGPREGQIGRCGEVSPSSLLSAMGLWGPREHLASRTDEGGMALLQRDKDGGPVGWNQGAGHGRAKVSMLPTQVALALTGEGGTGPPP